MFRYNFLPALLILWIFIFFKWRSWKYLFLSIAVSALTVGVLMVPYLMIDPEFALSVFFIMFGFLSSVIPLDYLGLLESDGVFLSGKTFSFKSLIGEVLSESRLKMMMSLFTVYFYIWTLLLFGIVFTVRKWKWRIMKIFKENDLLTLSLFLAGVILVAHFFFGPALHMSFSLYFMPYVILAVGILLFLVYEHLERMGIWKQSREMLISFFIIAVIFTSFSTAISMHNIIFFNRFDYSDSDLQRVKRGAQLLASNTTIDDVILTLDDPHHVFVAGRSLIPPLITKHIGHSESEDRELLARFHRYNTDMFMEWAENDATVIVFQRDNFEMRMSRIKATDRISEFREILDTKFEFVGSVENAYPLKYKKGEGIMEVYKRIELQI